MSDENKRYYWLKLPSAYFEQLLQKKMRKEENGLRMQVVYLRMLLCSLDKGGYIYYQGVYSSLEEELAEEFGEEIEIVEKTIQFLIDNHVCNVDNESTCFLPEVLKMTGSEGYSAERVRRHRTNKMLHCNAGVTQCNEEKRREREDKDKEIDKEGEEEKKRVREKEYEKIAELYNDLCRSLPRVTRLSETRKKALRARMNSGYQVEDFQKAFEMAEASSFLKGGNTRDWIATFDWIIKDTNMAKILEGNYSDKKVDNTKPLPNVPDYGSMISTKYDTEGPF